MNKIDMAAPMTVHTVLLCPVLFYLYGVHKTVAHGNIQGRADQHLDYLTDQTLMREACVFVLRSQLF